MQPNVRFAVSRSHLHVVAHTGAELAAKIANAHVDVLVLPFIDLQRHIFATENSVKTDVFIG